MVLPFLRFEKKRTFSFFSCFGRADIPVTWLRCSRSHTYRILKEKSRENENGTVNTVAVIHFYFRSFVDFNIFLLLLKREWHGSTRGRAWLSLKAISPSAWSCNAYFIRFEPNKIYLKMQFFEHTAHIHTKLKGIFVVCSVGDACTCTAELLAISICWQVLYYACTVRIVSLQQPCIPIHLESFVWLST